MFDRAKELLDPRKTFGQPAVRICEAKYAFTPPEDEQMVLRMMVRSPQTFGFKIPNELAWLNGYIRFCNKIHGQMAGKFSPFVYVTVRHGRMQSNRYRDDVWHVDGFSMRMPHVPEHNFIWASEEGTETLEQEVKLPANFDPMRHNIHQYFQDVADEKNMRVLQEKTIYAIDPYVIHRRPTVTTGIQRTFIRVSFLPVEIEDNTCMVNPLIGRIFPYNRTDIREELLRYPVQK